MPISPCGWESRKALHCVEDIVKNLAKVSSSKTFGTLQSLAAVRMRMDSGKHMCNGRIHESRRASCSAATSAKKRWMNPITSKSFARLALLWLPYKGLPVGTGT